MSCRDSRILPAITNRGEGRSGNLEGGFAMGSAHPSARQHENYTAPSPRGDANSQMDVSALIAENAQLRELVIQLSRIVIKNVADRK